MKTPEQKEANRLNAAKRRLEQPQHVAAIAKKAWENGGRERQRERNQRRKQEDFFGYHTQFARRFNPSLTRDDLIALWSAQDGLCGLTGMPLIARAGETQLDHIVPQARGGSHEIGNLRWVSAVANRAKRDLTDAEFLELCEAVAEWLGRRLLRSDSYPSSRRQA